MIYAFAVRDVCSLKSLIVIIIKRSLIKSPIQNVVLWRCYSFAQRDYNKPDTKVTLEQVCF